MMNKGIEKHSNYIATTNAEQDKDMGINNQINGNNKMKENEELKNNNIIDVDNEDNQKEILQKLKEIYEFYCEKKKNIDKNSSSFLISLPELCREYEINFRRILLGLLNNLPGEGVGYRTVCKIIIYKLLLIITSDTQNDICLNMNYKENKELGFLINISNSLYANLVQIFINDFNYDFLRYKAYQTIVFNDIKILKLLCEEHNNFFKEKILIFMNYNFSKYPECKMMSTILCTIII